MHNCSNTALEQGFEIINEFLLPTGWTEADYKAHLRRRASDQKRAKARARAGEYQHLGETICVESPPPFLPELYPEETVPAAPAVPPDTRLHRIYHLFDAHGTLLYVGISCDPLRRIQEHSKDKHWWLEVSRIELKQRFPDQKSAQSAEERDIKSLRPLYNVVHNGRRT